MKRFVYVILLVLSSCGNETQDQYRGYREVNFDFGDFSETKELKSKKYLFKEILVPHHVLVKSGKLIVSNLSSSDQLFVIDAASMELEFSKGRNGQGPDEIFEPWRMDKGLNDSTFWVYSISGKEFSEFSLKDDSYKPKRKIKQSGDFHQSLSMNWLGKDQIIAYQNVGPSRFSVFDPSGLRIRNHGYWNTSGDSSISENASFILSTINQGSIGVSSDAKYVVLAQVSTDSFEIIDLSTEEITKVIGPIKQELKYSIEFDGRQNFPYVNPDMKNGYNQVFVGKDGIFLVYMGRSDEEISKSGIMSKDVFVFDFNGVPLVHYKLDRSIKALAVDADSRRIYGVTFEKEPGIAVFEY
jgi:hypothetical protein